MSKALDDKKVENGSVARGQILYRPYDLLVRNSVQGILGVRSDLDHPIVKVSGELVLVILTKMVNSRVNHYFSQPTFERTHDVRICRFIPVYFFENFQKTVVQDLDRIVLVVCIPVTDSHSISVERGINLFLALSAV